MISAVVAALEWVWHLLESFVERIELWFVTRRWELAIAGLPACLVAAVLLFIIRGQQSKPAVAVAEPYRQALYAAMQAHDYERADLFLRKLQELQAADDNSRYQFAMLAAAEGKPEIAMEQIWALAPDGEEGYPPAHLWLAVDDLKRMASWNAEDHRRCMQHLNFAKADSGLRPRASELLGILHLLERDYVAAANELKSISQPTFITRVALAVAVQLANQQAASRTAWLEVAEASEEHLVATPGRTETRLVLASTYSRLGQNDKAIQVLRDGLQLPAGAADQRLQKGLELALSQRLNASQRSLDDPAYQQRLLPVLLEPTADPPAVAMKLIGW